LAMRFGFSVHAKDARKVEPAALAARAARASCVVACNEDVARQLRGSGAPAQLIPHGVDLHRFQMARVRTGRDLRVLAVGRLVPKKGFDVLIDAMAAIDRRITLRIVGDGPERETLRARIVERELVARVTLAGARTHTQLPDEYASAHVVVVPSVVDSAGDRDGLPNVVLEAMASGRPVVGSDVGAIAAAVKNARTGILVAPHSPQAIAGALELLASNVDLRVRLGRGARAEVARRYALHTCVERFARVLEVAYA
jgi:glycosyltransferase involved in cell wall biosynthesis